MTTQAVPVAQAVPARYQAQPATPQTTMSPAVWLLPILVPFIAPIVALVMWVKRDLCAGFAACAAMIVGWMMWAIVVLALLSQHQQF